jgi:hypothetical protein
MSVAEELKKAQFPRLWLDARLVAARSDIARTAAVVRAYNSDLFTFDGRAAICSEAARLVELLRHEHELLDAGETFRANYEAECQKHAQEDVE